MNFELKNTAVWHALRTERFFLFRFAKFFKVVFLFLSLTTLILSGLTFLNITPGFSVFKIFTLFFCLYLLFWNLQLFTELKIKKPKPAANILDAVTNAEGYNLASFLNINSCKIANEAIRFCKKRKIEVTSTALLFSAIKLSKDTKIICSRLGIYPDKLLSEIKNYLEKIPKQKDRVVIIADDFLRTVSHAIKISVDMGHESVGEKEIFSALSYEDEFFKNVLVQFDLKPVDVERLTAWLDSAEDFWDDNKKFWTYENLLRKGSLGKDFSSGYTPTLDRYSTDWRKIVSNWRFKEIIGHKKEIEQTETILAKTDMSNVLIIGEEGTGRKGIVQAIAQKCFLGTSLPELNGKRVVELDPVFLAAQIPDFEKLEETLDQILSEVFSAGNVILVIDDLENFVGQKVQKAGAFDLSAILAKYLPFPNFQFIGITTYEGLHKNMEESSSFVNMFEKVEVAEITEQETINTLQSQALELEYRHNVMVLYPSIREIVNLTARYMPSLLFPKKAIDVLNESVVYVQKLKEKIVLPHHIAEIVSKKTDIPVGKMEVKEKETLLNLENLIHGKIISQSEAVSEISVAMRRARMGIASKSRPMGTFLFLGPTGVGKTETAKALAEIYFGSEKKMIRIDMSEFQAISDIPRLIGSVSPVEMQGLLTTPVRESPFALVLLDEIEKAHPNILNLFLQVLDEGHITDGQGRKVVFTNTIIICTSNAGADIIFKQVESGQNLDKTFLLNSLFEKNIFRPEFVNRFDATVIFHPLTKIDLVQIAGISLKSLQKNLKEKEIDFEITEDLKQKIAEISYKPEFGAREMRRVIQDKVEDAVAQVLLSDQIKKGDKIKIDPENFQVIINSIK